MTRRNYMNICMMAMFGTMLAMISLEDYSLVDGIIKSVITIVIAYISAGILGEMED